MQRTIRFVTGVILVFALVIGALESASAAKPKVTATIAMIGQPVQQVAGEFVDVSILMGPGTDPHLFRPTRSDVGRLVASDLILWNGLDLEAQLEKTLHKLSKTKRVVAVGEVVLADRLLRSEEGKRDPHLWMDPQLWALVLERAFTEVAALVPHKSIEIEARAKAYLAELAELDRQAEQALATVPERARILVTAHDAFSYFGKRYGYQVEGVQGISTESEAGLKRIEDLVQLLAERRIPSVFVETSVSERNLRALIEGAAARGWTVRIGGTLYSDAMGAADTKAGTYLGMMTENVEQMVGALGGSTHALQRLEGKSQ